MDLSYLDYLANTANGLIRKCSVVSKLFLCICCVCVCLSTQYLYVISAVFILLIILNLACGMGVIRLLHFMFYPLFFSLAFVFMRLFEDPAGGSVILLKAMSSVLSLLLLLITTPFTDLFAFLGKFLPKVLVSSIFFTYRIFFVLVQQLTDALKSMRLRGKFRLSRLFFYLKSLASLLGSIFISAIDMSERMSTIYRIRGYRGKVYASSQWNRFSGCDCAVLALSLLLIGFSIAANFGGGWIG